jgi:catalase
MIPDNDPNANPRGFAVRFSLGGRKHTDIVTHSTPFFPTRTGGEFLEFLKALIGSPPGTPSPSPVEQFLGSHPKALAFVQAPKPPPSSFSREAYFGVTALKFVSAEGKSTYFRYRIVPDEGVNTLDEATVQEKGPNYLFEEIEERVRKGPFSFKLLAQLAEEGDVTDDATVHWPEDRLVVELGSLKVDTLVENNDKEQKHIIMDPIPRVQGIEPSDDPLLELRAAIYLISGRQRRAA